MSTKEYIGILFYDISINSPIERKYYNVFRKEILKKGFYQLQESVYICRYKYKEKSENDLTYISKLAPVKSNIRFILLTKQQFKMIRVISGAKIFIEKVLCEDKPILRL